MAKSKAKGKVEEVKRDKDDEAILKAIQGSFGKESIMLMDGNDVTDMPVISTSSISLDLALGVGGFPEGRIIEIYGPESSGKTTVALHACAEAQKLGKKVAFVDVEHALDPSYSKAIGVDLPRTFWSQPDSGEDALNIVDKLIDTGKIGLIILDSVAALTSQGEIDGEIGDHHMAPQARMMSQALKKLTPKIKKSKCTVIFINQTRMNIGGYGNPEVTSGGNALKFYASIRLRIGSRKMKGGDEEKEKTMTVQVVKNKVAPPGAKIELPITFGVGIDKCKEAYTMSVHDAFALVEKRGGSHYYRGLPITFPKRDEETGELIKDENGKKIMITLKNDVEMVKNEDGSFDQVPVTLEENEICKFAASGDKARTFFVHNEEVYLSVKDQLQKILREG